MTDRDYLQKVCNSLVAQLTNDLDRTEEEILAKTIRTLATDKATRFYGTWAVYWDSEFNAWIMVNLIDQNKIITKLRNHDAPPQTEAVKAYLSAEMTRLKGAADELSTALSTL